MLCVEALLTDALVSGQLYSRPPSLPYKLLSYLYIPVSGRGHFQGLSVKFWL